MPEGIKVDTIDTMVTDNVRNTIVGQSSPSPPSARVGARMQMPVSPGAKWNLYRSVDNINGRLDNIYGRLDKLNERVEGLFESRNVSSRYSFCL